MRAAVPREVNTELREADPKQESPRHLPPEARGGGCMVQMHRDTSIRKAS